MPPPTLLDIFLTLVRRPHTQCHRLQHLPSTPYLTRRAVSKKAERKTLSSISNTPPAHKPPANTPRAEPTSSSSASKIPLHVGLDRNPQNLSAISRIPIPRGVRGESFTPSVLSRPLGLPYPPEAGQNSPHDTRSWSERGQEFADKDKALERRRVYLRTYLRPYFQEWKRLDLNRGKVFRSNERMFRRDKALYFPNIVGQTLVKRWGQVEDSVGVMRGKISIVGMHSGRWAEEQVDGFVSPQKNEELQGIMKGSGGLVQRVDFNIQDRWDRWLVVWLSKGGIRRQLPRERWGRYFVVKLPRDIRKGLTEETRDAMGLLNSHVGFVYLVDSECKIRWAASGDPWEGEVEGLNNAVRRLIEEERPSKERKMVDGYMKPEAPAMRKKKVAVA